MNAKKENRPYTDEEQIILAQYQGVIFPADEELRPVQHLLDFIMKNIKVTDPTDEFMEDFGEAEMKLDDAKERLASMKGGFAGQGGYLELDMSPMLQGKILDILTEMEEPHVGVIDPAALIQIEDGINFLVDDYEGKNKEQVG